VDHNWDVVSNELINPDKDTKECRDLLQKTLEDAANAFDTEKAMEKWK